MLPLILRKKRIVPSEFMSHSGIIIASAAELSGKSMSEIIFLVEEDPECGYRARALGESIFTVGSDLDELRRMVRDAVKCHFEDAKTRPKVIRLHFVRDEVLGP